MRIKKRKITKFIIIIIALIILISVCIVIGEKINKINKEKELVMQKKEEIATLFNFSDLELNSDMITDKYGMGTPNYDGENRLFCTTYSGKIGNYNIVKIYYYDDNFNVKKIEFNNTENSKYEFINYLNLYFGETAKYNDEIKQLATVYTWNYEGYIIELKDNVYSISIIIKKEK